MPIELESFSLGAIAGSALTIFTSHLLAKIRDIESRGAKDFNEKAIALAEILTRERIEPSPGSNIDFVPFRLVLGNRELKRFDKCVAKYKSEKESAKIDGHGDNGELVRMGSGSFQDSTSIKEAIDNLLKFTKRK